MKKIIPVIIILAVGIALGIYFQRQPETQKIENKTQTDAEQAGEAVKGGVQKVEAAATVVKTNIEAGIQKSGKIATNVAAQVKVGAQKAGEVVTNAVDKIKDKLP